jgi:hypothetical protein
MIGESRMHPHAKETAKSGVFHQRSARRKQKGPALAHRAFPHFQSERPSNRT